MRNDGFILDLIKMIEFCYDDRRIDEGKESFIETILLGPIGDVDHASEARILLLQSVVSLVEVLEVEVLVYRDHVVVGTEF